jgi:membrane protein DedA with SNARE-associated domain
MNFMNFAFVALLHSGLIGSISGAVTSFMYTYGYLALFVLMLLESATLPVPSELVLPLAGILAAGGTLNFYAALLVAIVGSMVGTCIDYAIGYYLGKEVVYKHLHIFHIKKTTMDRFDKWFARNGKAAVLITRLIPVLRTVINFPAGFARMDLREFLLYSLIGIVIWDIALMLYGYLLRSLIASNSIGLILGGIGAFALILYVVYKVAASRMK